MATMMAGLDNGLDEEGGERGRRKREIKVFIKKIFYDKIIYFF